MRSMTGIQQAIEIKKSEEMMEEMREMMMKMDLKMAYEQKKVGMNRFDSPPPPPEKNGTI